MAKYIREFEEVGISDSALVGGKNASLGEMIRGLSSQGIRVPSGFAVTTEAYDELLRTPGVKEKLAALFNGLDTTDTLQLSRLGRQARAVIKEAGLPAIVTKEIREAYRRMETQYVPSVDVAVRSSATAEDLPEASFAGQQESFLNVSGENSVLEACLNCFASLFTDRAISYRADKGFNQLSVKLSVGVQKMVRSDMASAGVIFTLDPESGFRNAILVTSSYGLGENIVAGRVEPDEFLLFKPTLQTHTRPIIRRKIGAKQLRLVYAGHGTRTTKNVDVPPEERQLFSVSEKDILTLADWALAIEKHYSVKYERPLAMDIEWAKDGVDGQLYIVQARPETIHSPDQRKVIEHTRLLRRSRVLLSGRSVGERVGSGNARVIQSPNDLGTFKEGEVLVADMTDPDWEPIMKKAAAIVTNRGGRTCHAAIVSRELGVPCVVGTEHATELLANFQEITVSCADGASGFVFEGKLPTETEVINLDKLPWTKTRILVNAANPDHAFSMSSLPVDGVGLAREEFIIANEVKAHPLALTRFDKVTDPAVRMAINTLTRGFKSREDYFVNKLSEGIAMIAAAFFPREVIVRLSDFKTNEYANLIGGKYFEPLEANPMIGFRGACRYYDERYKDGFALECQALARVRDEMGLTNVKVMIPFCRTVAEGELVLREMALHGLVHGQGGLEIYLMCELPSNVLCMDEFASLFDGFSIGSNDLTQLTLGLDRDSEIVANLFDERNLAVQRTIAQAIAGAHKAHKKIGICGQAPSDYPEMVEFLVESGVDSISLNEDAVLKTLLMVASIETNIRKQVDDTLMRSIGATI